MEADCYWIYSALLRLVCHLQPDRHGILTLAREAVSVLPPKWAVREDREMFMQNVIMQPLHLSTLMKDALNRPGLAQAFGYMDAALAHSRLGENCDRIDEAYLAMCRAIPLAYDGAMDDDEALHTHMSTYVPSVQDFLEALAVSKNAWKQRGGGGGWTHAQKRPQEQARTRLRRNVLPSPVPTSRSPCHERR